MNSWRAVAALAGGQKPHGLPREPMCQSCQDQPGSTESRKAACHQLAAVLKSRSEMMPAHSTHLKTLLTHFAGGKSAASHGHRHPPQPHLALHQGEALAMHNTRNTAQLLSKAALPRGPPHSSHQSPEVLSEGFPTMRATRSAQLGLKRRNKNTTRNCLHFLKISYAPFTSSEVTSNKKPAVIN